MTTGMFCCGTMQGDVDYDALPTHLKCLAPLGTVWLTQPIWERPTQPSFLCSQRKQLCLWFSTTYVYGFSNWEFPLPSDTLITWYIPHSLQGAISSLPNPQATMSGTSALPLSWLCCLSPMPSSPIPPYQYSTNFSTKVLQNRIEQASPDSRGWQVRALACTPSCRWKEEPRILPTIAHSQE